MTSTTPSAPNSDAAVSVATQPPTPTTTTTATTATATTPPGEAAPRARRHVPSIEPPPPLWGLGFTGRIDRLQWITSVVMLLVVIAIEQVVALEHPHPSWVHVHRLVMGVAIVLWLRSSALRFHDRNRTGWWCLALLVPGLNLVAIFELSCLPGVDAASRHGHAPLGGSVLELLFGCALLGAFVGLGMLTFHPAYAIEPLEAPALRAAFVPYGSSRAKAAFDDEYATAASPKAYAASGRGAFGWSSATGSTSEALGRAIATCEARRRWTEPPCALLDVNNQNIASPATAPR